MSALDWYLVQPQRGERKWHLWFMAADISICGHVDKRLQELIHPPPHRRFYPCQACRAYAQRNNLKLPRRAITLNRKRATR